MTTTTTTTTFRATVRANAVATIGKTVLTKTDLVARELADIFCD